MWGTGTAAVISPVGELGYKGERYVINGGRTGALTQKLYDTIVGIQYGTAPDPYGWTRLLGNRPGGLITAGHVFSLPPAWSSLSAQSGVLPASS